MGECGLWSDCLLRWALHLNVDIGFNEANLYLLINFSFGSGSAIALASLVVYR